MSRYSICRRYELFREMRPGSRRVYTGNGRTKTASIPKFCRDRAQRIRRCCPAKSATALESRIEQAVRVSNPLWGIDNYSALLDAYGSIQCTLQDVGEWLDMQLATYIGKWRQLTIKLICRIPPNRSASLATSINTLQHRTHIELICGQGSLVFNTPFTPAFGTYSTEE